MIAQREKVVVEKTSETTSTQDDLFAGLHFPQVPTTAVQPNFTSVVTEYATSNKIEVREVPLIETNHQAPKDLQKKKTGSLSTLYATTEPTLETLSLYPELPSIVVNKGTTTKPDSIQGSCIEYGIADDNIEETDSLLPRASTNITTGKAIRNDNFKLHEKHSSDSNEMMSSYKDNDIDTHREPSIDLVTDLVKENTRLANELNNLRKILEMQNDPISQSSNNHIATAGPTAPTVNFNQPQSQQQNIVETGNGSMQTVSSESVTGTLVSDTTQPPQKGIKYVCCGGCRQWLMAPREAVYVVCSTCEAINNCNLAPKDNNVHNRNTDTRALIQQRKPFSG